MASSSGRGCEENSFAGRATSSRTMASFPRSVQPDRRARLLSFVNRRRGIESATYEQPHGWLWQRSRRGVIEEVVAGANDVGRPGIVAATGDHVRSGLAATACITEPVRRHLQPSSDWNAGSPLPVA